MPKASFNYDKIIYTAYCKRKHLIQDQQYMLYVLPGYLIISKILKIKRDPNPKYVLSLELMNTVHWQVSERNCQLSLSAFGFEYNNTIKYFNADNQSLIRLKSHLSLKVMFRQVYDFFLTLHCLGNGSSSHVQLVQDNFTPDRLLASKCVDKDYINEDPMGMRGLMLEIENMQRLQHPNILNLYEVYEGDQTFYLLLDYLQGPSLRELFIDRQNNGFMHHEIKLIMRQILLGVEYMHSQNIMHRDLKPENIMFQYDNSLEGLKIVDFGLATPCNVHEYIYLKCGTPGYIAPEIANISKPNDKYTEACDIFSAGVILYKLFTQRDLFSAPTFDQIFFLNRQCKINFTILQVYRPPRWGVELLTMMLQVDPSLRVSAFDALKHPFFESSETQPYEQPTINQKAPQTKTHRSLGNYNDDSEVVEWGSSQDDDLPRCRASTLIMMKGYKVVKLDDCSYAMRTRNTTLGAQKMSKRFKSCDFNEHAVKQRDKGKYQPTLLKQTQNKQSILN